MFLVDFFSEQFQTVLVGDILNHDCCSAVFLDIGVANLENTLINVLIFGIVVIIRVKLIVRAVRKRIIDRVTKRAIGYMVFHLR
jgi:hypothetical protein